MSAHFGPAVGFTENLDADDIFEVNRTEPEYTYIPTDAALYGEGSPWVKIEKLGGGTLGRRYSGYWNTQIWVRGEIVYQGALETGSVHTHHEAAVAAWELFIANDADWTEDVMNLLCPATSHTHAQVLYTGDGEHCLTCGAQGAPLEGRCPNESNLIHGSSMVSGHILDDCPAYERWGTCRHVVHSCQCEMCLHG